MTTIENNQLSLFDNQQVQSVARLSKLKTKKKTSLSTLTYFVRS